MNRKELLDKIKRYLSNFQNQVAISTDNNEYDISIHAETVLIPLLNIVLNGSFENLQYSDKNAQAIDLLDRNSGTAIQVTSTKELNKIKLTLEKLKTSIYGKEVKKLYIFILTRKQGSYSAAPINRIIGTKTIFNVKDNIWDSSDLYRSIQSIVEIDEIKEIENILKKNFSELYLSETLSETNYADFRLKYRDICIDTFSRLNFFGLSVQRKPREVDLYHLFVKPRFSISEGTLYGINNYTIKINKTISENFIGNFNADSEKDDVIKYLNTFEYDTFKTPFPKNFESLTEVRFEGLFSQNKHIVLLGNPGAGKSSIIKFAICKILERDLDVFSDKKVFDTLPLRVEIHKYNQFKIERKAGLVDYLSALLADEYQLMVSSKDINQILKYYRTTLFFDGLDEIFDIQQRMAVRNDIESFIKTYDKARSVVTSRFESYTEVSLDEKSFVQLEVKNFNDDQIGDYVNKWYGLEEKNAKVKKEESTNCLKQLTSVDSELKCNPLLLSLILILYRNELEIPTSKLEIYENCTTTIVDHRDNKEKKLLFNLTITNPLAIFSSLAYWQFDHQKQELVADDVLLFIKRNLLDKGEIDDDLEASKAAMEFLEFAKVRSIYFENKFTHKTFLEYFTSYFIYSNLFSKPKNHEQFEKLVTNNISLSSWSVVLELLICKIDSMQIDFEVIDQIIEKQLQENGEHAVLFFLTIVRYLKNISPRVRQKLINAGVLACIFPISDKKKKNQEMMENVFAALVSLSKILRFDDPIKKGFQALIKEHPEADERLAVFAYEFELSNNKIKLTNYLDSVPEDSNYILFLKKFQKLERDNYLHLIEDLVKSSRKKDNLKVDFSSKYGQPIFNGSRRINLLLSYMNAHQAKDLEKAYRTLLDIGISFSDLKKIATKLARFYNIQITQQLYHDCEDNEVKRLFKITQDIKANEIKAFTHHYSIDSFNKNISHQEILKQVTTLSKTV